MTAWLTYAIEVLRQGQATRIETVIEGYTCTAYRVPSGDSYYIRIDIK